jgi:biopolymer transport protein ExbD
MARRLTGSTTAAAPFHAINLTPMVPVLLALFVAVALTPQADQMANIRMPVATAGSVCSCLPGRDTSLTIRNDRYFIEGEEVVADALSSRLQARAAQTGRRRVLIMADADTPYGQFAIAARRVTDAGFAVMLVNEDIH